MVLETIAATLLTKYLGDYLGGLSKENLNLSILSGNVTLENVELKREAVDSLDLPLVVKTGIVIMWWLQLNKSNLIGNISQSFLWNPVQI